MRLDDSLEAVLGRWPAGPFPPVPEAATHAGLAGVAERILDKVAEVCEHPLDSDLRTAVVQGVAGDDNAAIGLIADLGQQIWQTREYAQEQGEHGERGGRRCPRPGRLGIDLPLQGSLGGRRHARRFPLPGSIPQEHPQSG